MKIGIVSCYFINNYGSILQAYALQEYFGTKKESNVILYPLKA